MRDFGENERTEIIARDFIKDNFKWTGCIDHISRIGKKIEGGRDRHLRVILRNTKDKNMILRNRGLRRGTYVYLY